MDKRQKNSLALGLFISLTVIGCSGPGEDLLSKVRPQKVATLTTWEIAVDKDLFTVNESGIFFADATGIEKRKKVDGSEQWSIAHGADDLLELLSDDSGIYLVGRSRIEKRSSYDGSLIWGVDLEANLVSLDEIAIYIYSPDGLVTAIDRFNGSVRLEMDPGGFAGNPVEMMSDKDGVYFVIDRNGQDGLNYFYEFEKRALLATADLVWRESYSRSPVSSGLHKITDATLYGGSIYLVGVNLSLGSDWPQWAFERRSQEIGWIITEETISDQVNQSGAGPTDVEMDKSGMYWVGAYRSSNMDQNWLIRGPDWFRFKNSTSSGDQSAQRVRLDERYVYTRGSGNGNFEKRLKETGDFVLKLVE